MNRMVVKMYFKDPKGQIISPLDIEATSTSDLTVKAKRYYREHLKELRAGLGGGEGARERILGYEANFEIIKNEYDKTGIINTLCQLFDNLDNKYLFKIDD